MSVNSCIPQKYTHADIYIHAYMHTHKAMNKIYMVSCDVPVATVFHGCFKKNKEKKKKKYIS